jgi:rhomboid protease GluP
MDPQPREIVPDASFAVEYEAPSGVANRELSGKGYLIVGGTEPRFLFSGKSRVWSGRDTTLEFRSEEIWNATANDTEIQFELRKGKSSRGETPFIFFCSTAAEATQVIELLPQTKDDEFFARQEFGGKLTALPSASGPWSSVTNLLIAANFAAFVVMGFLGAGWFETPSVPRLDGPYVLYVANNAGATTDGEWWRIVTCMFVHYGAIHLLLNMWALFQTGPLMERLLGRALYTVAYFGSGIIASFATLFWNRDRVWSAGASGAVFGVFGMLLGFILREKHAIPKSVIQPMLKSTLLVVGFNLLYGITNPRIGNAAHLGGFVAGFALGWLLALPLDLEARARHWANRFFSGIAVIFVATAIGVIFSPRFDYRFREELRWEMMIREPVAQKDQIIQRRHELLAQFKSGNDAQDLIEFAETRAIPFYEKWREQLESVAFTPNTATERRRIREIKFMQATVANYRQLVADLREKNPAAIRNYLTAETRASAENSASKK